MKPWNAGLAIFLATGLSLSMAGCGGGSPDPDEETTATATDVEDAATTAATDGAETASVEPPAVEPPAAETPPAAGPSPTEPASAPPPPTAKAEDATATKEMLQTSLTVASAAPAPAETPANPAPATSSGAPTDSSASETAMRAAYANQQPTSSGTSSSTSDSTGAAANEAAMRAAYANQQPGSSGPNPYPTGESSRPEAAGAEGGPASGPGADQPSDFSNAGNAVVSFLNALRARNIDGLAEAVALHAPTDAKPQNQKLFRAILDTSISDEMLNSLAEELEGFQIIGQNRAESTGRVEVIVGKVVPNSNPAIVGVEGTRVTRMILVRRERAGWKVQDIGPTRTSPIRSGRRR